MMNLRRRRTPRIRPNRRFLSRLQPFRRRGVLSAYCSAIRPLRSGPLSDENRDERLQIMLTEHELAALDDWRFTRRMPSRAAAVRELLRLGLSAEGIDLPEGRRKSTDFGVTNGSGRNGDG